MTGIDWVGVDWGTSNVRAWGLASDGRVIAEASSDKGMSKLDRAGFEPALLDLIGDWLPHGRRTPVVACGMVGARQGWLDVPYRDAPCSPAAVGGVGHPQARDQRLLVNILPGLRQIDPTPDVMRGEETQIAGLLSDEPGFEGVVCLPGTHTKWVRVAAREIACFQTFMTGELFDLIGTHSVLRHSLGGDGWEEGEFMNSIEAMMAAPESFAARLFSIRAEALVSGLAPAAARARLSGLLIGAELAAARPYWWGRDVLIVGNNQQAELYVKALSSLGAKARNVDATKVTLAGLRAAHEQIVQQIVQQIQQGTR
jgi:2-dehydro-3-deoxygalactonokinase